MKLLHVVLSLAVPAVVAPSAYFIHSFLTTTDNKSDFIGDNIHSHKKPQRAQKFKTGKDEFCTPNILRGEMNWLHEELMNIEDKELKEQKKQEWEKKCLEK